MLSKTPAYTILELIIVMGLIAILSGVGILGMSLFQQNSEEQSAASEFFANIQSYENMARNSVPSQVLTGTGLLANRVDGYAVFFSNGDYSLYYCFDQVSATGKFNCQGVEQANAKSKQFKPVSIAPQPTELPRCSGILFERKTGLIYSMASLTATPVKTGDCHIELIHSNNLSKKMVWFNLTANTYAFQ